MPQQVRNDKARLLKALELRKQGWSQRRIARELGVNASSVSRWFADPAHFLAVADGEQGNAPSNEAPPAASSDEGDAPTWRREKTPEPDFVPPEVEDAPRCGNCKHTLDDRERPARCPDCDAHLMWPGDA